MSSCELDFETGDCDQVAMYSAKIVKGRKDYKCAECGDHIPNGTPHESASGLSDGEWWNYRTCLACKEIRDEFTKNGFIFGSLWEAMNEDCQEMPLGSLEIFSPHAQQKLTAMLG